MSLIAISLTVDLNNARTRFDFVQALNAILEVAHRPDAANQADVLRLLNDFVTRCPPTHNDLRTIASQVSQQVLLQGLAGSLNGIEAGNERLNELTPQLVEITEKAKRQAKQIQFVPIVQHLNNAAKAIEAVRLLHQTLGTPDGAASTQISAILTAIATLGQSFKKPGVT